MNKVVEQLIKKELFKRGGVMASKEAVERAYRALAAKMEPLGLDITAIKSEADYNRVVGFVKSLEDQVFAKKFGDTLTKKESAEIFDLDKNKLNPNEPIIGGTQDEKEMLKKSIDRNVKQATEKGDFTGIANQVLRDPDIAREFMLSKKFPFRTAEGEEAIPLAMRAKFDEEMGIKSIPQRDDSFKQIIKDFRTFGKATDEDIQTITKSGKMAQIPYVMDNYGMSYREVIDTLKRGDPLIEGLATGGRAGFRVGKKVVEKIVKPKKTLKSIEETGMIDISDPEIAAEFAKYMKQVDPNLDAKMQQIVDDINQRIELRNLKKEKGRKENSEGGRIGYKVGSKSKRAFLKVMGGLAATIAAIKSGLIGVPKKEVAKTVIKETAKDVGSAPPSYFFDLANKIKLLGKESKVKPQERVNEYNYKGKDGSEYTLTEDIGTGDMQIVKEKGGVGIADDKAFDTIEDRTVMDYKKGRGDETTQGTPADEYDEYRVDFDVDGTPADADEISEIVKKEIIEEASEMPQKKIKVDLSEENLKESIDKFKKIDEAIDTVDQNINKKIKRASGGVAYMLGE